MELQDGLIDPDAETAVSLDLTHKVAQWLQPMAAQLPQKYREAIQLVAFEGISQREMGQPLPPTRRS